MKAYKFTINGTVKADSKDAADIIINVLMNNRDIEDAQWISKEVQT
jgi:hypothetical protein